MIAELSIILHLCSMGMADPVDCRQANLIIANCGGIVAAPSARFDSCINGMISGGRIEETPAGTTILRGR